MNSDITGILTGVANKRRQF
uniref:Uncharacterized protein n=1 Tax=Arundo donax TaxID=35708 RepID=A0A0A9FAW9_ARUDO